jgi:cytochrome c oxidase cbb3-type subunit III
MKLISNCGMRRTRNYPRTCAASVILVLGSLSLQAQRGPLPNTNPFHGNQQALDQGREIYNKTCTACHGKDGEVGDRGPGLGIPGRHYLRNRDEEIFDAILKGVPGTDMPPSGLSETDAWKVAAYIRALRGTAIDAPAKGDVARGEQIFRGKGGCMQCHMLGGKGGLIGPDLTYIASQRKLSSIIDALTKVEHPIEIDGGRHDSQLMPLANYQAVRVTTQDGRTIRGILKNQDSISVQMLGFDNVLYAFMRSELRAINFEPKSLMPTDYDKRLTRDEFQDLLAFLSRQGSVAEAPVGRGQQ